MAVTGVRMFQTNDPHRLLQQLQEMERELSNDTLKAQVSHVYSGPRFVLTGQALRAGEMAFVDTTVAGATLVLPSARQNAGRTIALVKVSSANGVIVRSGNESVDGVPGGGTTITAKGVHILLAAGEQGWWT